MCDNLNPLALGIQKGQERLALSKLFCRNTQILTRFVGFRKL